MIPPRMITIESMTKAIFLNSLSNNLLGFFRRIATERKKLAPAAHLKSVALKLFYLVKWGFPFSKLSHGSAPSLGVIRPPNAACTGPGNRVQAKQMQHWISLKGHW